MPEHSSPYRDIHSNLSSVFSSAQPVDTAMESIRHHVQKGIPSAVDDLLFLHGSLESEVSSNGPAGAIELFPALAETRHMTDGANSREYRRSESMLAALSSHEYFPMSHVRVYRSQGAISEFSLVFSTPKAKGSSFELHGSLTLPGYGDELKGNEFYWLEFSDQGHIEPALALDEAAAADIINAACLQHNEDEIPASITEKLAYLLEKSPVRTNRRMGEYAINGGERIVTANRSEVITKRMARDAIKLMGYGVRVQQTVPVELDGISATSTLTIAHDATARPRYNAFYDMIINDPHQTIDRDERTRLFEESFMLYRSKPELFFDEIASALEQVGNP